MKKSQGNQTDTRFALIVKFIALFGVMAFISMAIIAYKNDALTERFFACCDQLIHISIGAIAGALAISRKQDENPFNPKE